MSMITSMHLKDKTAHLQIFFLLMIIKFKFCCLEAYYAQCQSYADMHRHSVAEETNIVFVSPDCPKVSHPQVCSYLRLWKYRWAIHWLQLAFGAL